MINQIKKLTAIERLELYLNFLRNKQLYSEEERRSLEELFEEDG